MLLCASNLRPPRARGAQAIVRLAAEVGADGLFVGRDSTVPEIRDVAVAAMAAGLTVAAIQAPLPPGPLARGRRLPGLAADDREERSAAVRMAVDVIAEVAALGVRTAALGFGEVALASSWREVAMAFARRELADDEPGAPLLGAAIAERRARSARLLDACRWALDALVADAERRQVRLVLPVAASPWEVPTAREATMLVDAYRGAPVALGFGEGRLAILRRFGLVPPEPTLRRVVAATALLFEEEAVGIEGGYLPGLGEPEPAVVTRSAELVSVVSGSADSGAREVAAAVDRVRARTVPPA